jgi:hypothetical protein
MDHVEHVRASKGGHGVLVQIGSIDLLTFYKKIFRGRFLCHFTQPFNYLYYINLG